MLFYQQIMIFLMVLDMTIIHLNSQAAKPVDYRKIEQQILFRSQAEAAANNAGYSGVIEPEEAWKLFTSGIAHLVDIRRKQDRYQYGHVPNTFHVQWSDESEASETFAQRLLEKLSRDSFIMLLNCQGRHDEAELAARTATEEGFAHVFVVRAGYEDQPYTHVICTNVVCNEERGWRARGLPWVAGQE